MVRPTDDDLAERTLALCRIPSPIGSEKALADFVEAWARALPGTWEVTRMGHSLVVGPLSDGRPLLTFFGHLDTVPAHPADTPAHRRDARLHGLGSSDMKGGLAVMMALAETLPRDGPLGVAYVFYEREEGPYTESGLPPLLERVAALRRTRLGVALEPTDNVVQLGCMGSLHATVRFLGKSAHSARPWQGDNAIHKAGPLLSALAQRERREVRVGDLSYYEVMSVTRAQGGRARNVVPDAFELNLNYRFAPGKSLAQAQDEVRAVAGGGAAVDFIDLAPSGRACLENPLAQLLIRASGASPQSKQAWTDVGRLSEAGIDAVNFGPGETAQAHQADESAPVPALGAAYDVLARFVAEVPQAFAGEVPRARA
jgi:succinyl-diaminopimelate desuccinylase